MITLHKLSLIVCNSMLHCGKKQQNYAYALYGEVMEFSSNITYLGIVIIISAMYFDQIHLIASKAAKQLTFFAAKIPPEKEKFYDLFYSMLPIVTN